MILETLVILICFGIVCFCLGFYSSNIIFREKYIKLKKEFDGLQKVFYAIINRK